MKILKVLVIILVVIGGLYSAWMASLPSSYTLEKTTVIDAEPAMVYNTVTDLQSWEHWSYWHKMDTTNVTSYTGSAKTVGSSFSWNGEQTGEGTFTVTNLEENKKMDYSLAFAGSETTDGYFNLEEIEEGKTQVTYALNAQFGFFDRIGKYFIDSQVGKAFETSLSDLKVYVESLPAEEKNTYTFSIMENTPVDYIGIREELNISELSSDLFDQRYQDILAFAGDDAANMNGTPFAIYEKWDMDNDKVILIIAMPITTTKKASDNIIIGKTHAGKVLKTTHTGSYESSGEAHWAIDSYVKENNLMINGSPWEVYVNNPGNEPDPAKLITDIYYPVATAEDMGSAE